MIIQMIIRGITEKNCFEIFDFGPFQIFWTFWTLFDNFG